MKLPELVYQDKSSNNCSGRAAIGMLQRHGESEKKITFVFL